MVIERNIDNYINSINYLPMFNRNKVVSEYYILVDKNNSTKPKIFKFNGTEFIFACHQDDWDSKGWIDDLGFNFKERLFILMKPTNCIWKKINLIDLEELYSEYNFLHPKNIRALFKNGMIKFFLMDL